MRNVFRRETWSVFCLFVLLVCVPLGLTGKLPKQLDLPEDKPPPLLSANLVPILPAKPLSVPVPNKPLSLLAAEPVPIPSPKPLPVPETGKPQPLIAPEPVPILPPKPISAPETENRPSLSSVEPVEVSPTDDPLRKLLKARYNEAVAELKLFSQAFPGGRWSIFDMEEVSQRVVNSGLELFENPADKIALLTKAVEWAITVEKIYQAQAFAARISETLLHRARYNRLNAEILLLRTTQESSQTSNGTCQSPPIQCAPTGPAPWPGTFDQVSPLPPLPWPGYTIRHRPGAGFVRRR